MPHRILILYALFRGHTMITLAIPWSETQKKDMSKMPTEKSVNPFWKKSIDWRDSLRLFVGIRIGPSQKIDTQKTDNSEVLMLYFLAFFFFQIFLKIFAFKYQYQKI